MLERQKKDEILDSNSFTQMMRQLFIVFHNKRILYDYKKDVNANGEFHGVCLSMWKHGKTEDSKFGTFENRAEMDEEVDRNIRDAQEEGIIDPFQEVKNSANYTALLRRIIWILERDVCICGHKEIAKCKSTKKSRRNCRRKYTRNNDVTSSSFV